MPGGPGRSTTVIRPMLAAAGQLGVGQRAVGRQGAEKAPEARGGRRAAASLVEADI